MYLSRRTQSAESGKIAVEEKRKMGIGLIGPMGLIGLIDFIDLPVIFFQHSTGAGALETESRNNNGFNKGNSETENVCNYQPS